MTIHTPAASRDHCAPPLQRPEETASPAATSRTSAQTTTGAPPGLMARGARGAGTVPLAACAVVPAGGRPLSAEAAAHAYKQANAERAAVYAEQPAGLPMAQKKKKKLAQSLASFAVLRHAAMALAPAPPEDPTDRLGVLPQPRNMNRTDAAADESERPGKVRTTTATRSAGLSIATERHHATGATAAHPAVIPAMDFASVYHRDLKNNPPLDDATRARLEAVRRKHSSLLDALPARPDRNPFPERDAVADTQRLRRALTDPPAALDQRGAHVAGVRRLGGMLPMGGPDADAALMGRAHKTLRKRARQPVRAGGTAQQAEPQRLRTQQQRLMEELLAKEEVRIAKISRQRTKAYIAKAERNLLDAQQTLAALESAADPQRTVLNDMREAAALQIVLSRGAMPDVDGLRGAGLGAVAVLADEIGRLQPLESRLAEAQRRCDALAALDAGDPRLEGDDEDLSMLAALDLQDARDALAVQRRRLDEAAAHLEPSTVTRYVNHLADRMFADLVALRDPPHVTARLLGPEVSDALTRLLAPKPQGALEDLARRLQGADLEQRLNDALGAAERSGNDVSAVEGEIAMVRRSIERLDRDLDRETDRAAPADAARARRREALVAELTGLQTEWGELKLTHETACADAMLLRRAGDLGTRLSLMPIVERAAGEYLSRTVAQTRPLRELAARAPALREAAEAAVRQIGHDLDAMRAHLTAQQERGEALESEMNRRIDARRAEERSGIEALLDSLGDHGFATAAPAQQQALKTALMGLYDRIDKRFFPDEGVAPLEARASSPAMVVGGALRALAAASQGDVGRAAAIVDNLAQASIPALARTGQGPGAVSDEARAAAVLLAQVPRGMEILQHLTGHIGKPFLQGGRPPDANVQAVQIFLKSRAHHADPADWPSDVRAQVARFRQQAGEAAALAAASDDPTRALAEHASVEQRAAYHALRNGMDNNAPGSPYDRGNQALIELRGWLRGLGEPDSLAINPFHALDQAVNVMQATGGPTLRRMLDASLRGAGDALLEFVSQSQAQAPQSFERAALQSLLQEVVFQPESADLGTLEITPRMLDRARTAARGMGLRRGAPDAVALRGDALRRIAAESAAEGLVDAADTAGAVEGHAVVTAVRGAMTGAGMSGGEGGFTDEQMRAFVDGLAQAHPGSAGVQTLKALFDRALPAPGERISASDLAGITAAAMPRRRALLPAERDALPDGARAVHELVETLRMRGNGLSGLSVLHALARMVLPSGPDAPERSDPQALALLPELRAVLDGLARSLPDVESLQVMRALVARMATGPQAHAGEIEGLIEGVIEAGPALPFASYRVQAEQRRAADAAAAFDAIWARAEAGDIGVAGLLTAARQQLAAQQAPGQAPPALQAFDASMAIADEQKSILDAPSPTDADGLLDKLKHSLANMTWRDRQRMAAAQTFGLNTDKLVTVPLMPGLSVQGKVILGIDQRREAVFESFMSSPAGPQVVVGLRDANVGEAGLGAGVSGGVLDEGTVGVNLRAYLEARGRREHATENGVSLRIPRYLGQEATLHEQFVDLVNNLFRVARDTPSRMDGAPPDLFGELLAACPDASVGTLQVHRRATTVEGLFEGGGNIGLGPSGSLGANGGILGRREAGRTVNYPAAYVDWVSVDSFVRSSVVLYGGAGWMSSAIPAAQATISGVPANVMKSVELVTALDRRLAEQTYFGGEHFYDWAAIGFEKTDMAAFRDSVLARLSQWSELAAIRAPAGIAEEDRYALGEKFVLDLVSQAVAIGQRNATTTAVSFDILFQELDAQIDHLHREGWFAAQRGDTAAQAATERLIEELFQNPDARKVALMHVSNSTRQSARVSFNQIVKAQASFTGESRKTMAQVPQANPIVDAQRQPLGLGVQPARPLPAPVS